MAGVTPERAAVRAAGTVPEISHNVLPSPETKHEYVRAMFDAIAPRYDFLNALLSAQLHHYWRWRAGRQTQLHPGDTALDVCTGTGDFAFELARRVGPTGQVTATDFSAPMLALGDEKRRRRKRENLQFRLADTQNLPFLDNSFDAVTVGFGIRNVADIERGLREMARVTRPGGRVVLLEFNQPTNPVFAAFYRWYSFTVLPYLGGLVSGRRTAYEYLPSSVAAFHSRADLTRRMEQAGLTEITVTDLTFGVAVIHRGIKSKN